MSCICWINDKRGVIKTGKHKGRKYHNKMRQFRPGCPEHDKSKFYNV